MAILMIKDLSHTEPTGRKAMAEVRGGIIDACAPTPTMEPGMTLGDFCYGLTQYLANIKLGNGLNCDGSAGQHP